MILSIGYEWLLPLKFGGQRRHCSTGSFGGVITRPGQDVVVQYTPCKLAVIYFCFTPRASLQNHWTDTNCFIWKLGQVLHFSIIPSINNCYERLKLVCHSWRTFWLVVVRMILSARTTYVLRFHYGLHAHEFIFVLTRMLSSQTKSHRTRRRLKKLFESSEVKKSKSNFSTGASGGRST